MVLMRYLPFGYCWSKSKAGPLLAVLCILIRYFSAGADIWWFVLMSSFSLFILIRSLLFFSTSFSCSSRARSCYSFNYRALPISSSILSLSFDRLIIFLYSSLFLCSSTSAWLIFPICILSYCFPLTRTSFIFSPSCTCLRSTYDLFAWCWFDCNLAGLCGW